MGVLSWLRSRGIRKRAIDALRHGRLGEATAAFEEAVSIAESDWQAWCSLGECHHALGQFDAAQRAFERCLELNPVSVEAKEGRALLYGERDHNWPRCLVELAELLTIATEAGVPEFTELNIAWAHSMQGDLAKAEGYFDAALGHMSRWQEIGVERDAEFSETEYRIGALYHSLKSDRDQALRHLRRAVELSPESIFARDAKARIEEISGGKEGVN
jgi:tetratricopeptide (TPR) repeat protein